MKFATKLSLVASIALCPNASLSEGGHDSELATEVVELSDLQQRVLSISDAAKRLSLTNFVSSDLRSEDIKKRRTIAIEEWNRAQDRIKQVYIEATETTLSETEQRLLLDFFEDQALQVALSKLGNVEQAALPDLARIVDETSAIISQRIAEEVPE
ncbi:hypothetical protein [Tateyamaria sp. syn59]|uniref:hypothetical protein n=1 Tax=Tateyamaria sp. syn59 TaxID=2576942 RepID=UPI0011BE7511|nr:hypothetical protein [Tateyamaria sp. syn59]